jgi:hypothetical protein
MKRRASITTKPAANSAFVPRDPGDTLNDTVRYVRENFLGGK